MSSTLQVGQVIRGNNSSYELGKRIKNPFGASAVFRAHAQSSEVDYPATVIVKTASPSLIKNERDMHLRRGISSCQSIRPLLDTIEHEGTMYLVFPWFDSTLGEIKWNDYHRKHSLFAAVVSSVLETLVALQHERIVHTGEMGGLK
jgi:hypothetical protein